MCFWLLGISLYLELFCFLSLFLLFYIISASVPGKLNSLGNKRNCDKILFMLLWLIIHLRTLA